MGKTGSKYGEKGEFKKKMGENMDRNQKEEGKNNQESNQLTLKSVYDFFYKCDREKDCVFYTDEYEKLPPNIKNARKTQRYFLDTHFGEYLVQQGKQELLNTCWESIWA